MGVSSSLVLQFQSRDDVRRQEGGAGASNI